MEAFVGALEPGEWPLFAPVNYWTLNTIILCLSWPVPFHGPCQLNTASENLKTFLFFIFGNKFILNKLIKYYKSNINVFFI